MSQPPSNPPSQPDEKAQQPTLALPSASSESDTTKIDVSSGQGTVKMDQLGPMVVNVDGTLSRITNWEAMTEMERTNTLRIISKRNKERLEKLKEGEKGEGGS
jgi:hypothetical protein